MVPMKLNLNTISYSTAISLAGFSGAVATYGMCKLVPGGELVIAGMGTLFEAGKLSSFALLHRRGIPRLLKVGLATVGLTLMTANVAGVSGFLSNAYERSQIAARATSHTAETTAHASASLVERQLAAAEGNLAQARQALVRARDDRGRAKAAQQIVDKAIAERDSLIKQLAAAQATTAKVEGDTISAGSEFAAIQFIAGATGASTDTVAHAAILTISAIPDVLAVLLLLAAGYAPAVAHGGAREGAGRPKVENQVVLKSRPARKRRTSRKPANLKIVNAKS
jgi:hypothetical protein